MGREEALAKLALFMLAASGWADPGCGITDVDGGDLQEEAERLGLLVKRPHTSDEVEDCYCVVDEAGKCNGGDGCEALFLADGLTAAIEAADATARASRGEGS